ncbi:MAG: heparinase II/III-family protein, partial [Saprospiraceae bacterium]
PNVFPALNLTFFKETAGKMLAWLRNMQFKNGQLARLKDSTPQIAPSASQLLHYAQNLGVQPATLPLNASGYRMQRFATYELLVDMGSVIANYIPGHAHADIFNFVLHHRQQPLLVDTGISTYEKNAQRQHERSTAAHNTVQIGEWNQSDVWGGFRVGKRAQIYNLQEDESVIKATHDGYTNLGIQHERSFRWQSDGIDIDDRLNDTADACARFHFHPDVRIELEGNRLVGRFGQLTFTHHQKIELQTYQYASAYNQLIAAPVAVVYFDQQLTTQIRLV